MSFDRRGVDQQFGRWPAGRCQGRENVYPHAFGGPAHKSVVQRLPRAIDGRRISPATAGFQDMHDATDHPAIIDPRLAARIGRKMRREPGKLSLIQPKMIVIHDRSPFGDLESRNAPAVNLEASVRSRGAGGEGRPSRDLIEAGLSEPAGWRARLWRLCLRRRVRGAPSAETGEHLDGLIAIGEGDCGRQIRVGNVALDAATALLAQLRIRAVPANATIRTGATGVRRRMSGAAEPSVPHEVSSQNDERAGVARIRMPRMTMVPPQLGHRSGLCTAGVSGSCSADGAGDGAASRLRHSTRLAAR